MIGDPPGGRHALHAMTLGFVHPVTGQHLSFERELPADLATALAALRALDPARLSRAEHGR